MKKKPERTIVTIKTRERDMKERKVAIMTAIMTAIIVVIMVAMVIAIIVIMAIVIIPRRSEAWASSTPITGLTEEQLKELRSLAIGRTKQISGAELDEEHNRPPDVEVKWLTSPLASQRIMVNIG